MFMHMFYACTSPTGCLQETLHHSETYTGVHVTPELAKLDAASKNAGPTELNSKLLLAD